jgi:glucose/arabinose dehydrogenase
MKPFSILSVTVVAIALTVPAPSVAGGPAGLGSGAHPRLPALSAKPILTNLPFPAAFTFLPDGKLVYGERNSAERSGENHAWGPSETCSGQAPDDTNQDGPQPRILPLAWFATMIAPTGAAFCDGCGLTGSEGALFFGAYDTAQIRRVKLTSDRKGISSMAVVFTAAGPVLSMQNAPDGHMYFGTPDAIYQLQG